MLTSMTGRSDHDRRPDDDGHRAQLDRHRPHAGRARAARLPDDDRRRGAQRAALEQRRRRPPARVPAPRRAAVRRVHGPRRPGHLAWPSWRARGSPRPTCSGRARSGGGRCRRSPSRSAASCGPASGSSTPTTAASTRRPTSAASASSTTPSCASPTGSSPTSASSCRPGAVLLVTADHGQVEVGPNIIEPDPELLAMVTQQSGEGRFRWWHTARGGADELAEAAAERYDDVAWVVTREQVLDEHWFGPTIVAADRLPPRRRRPRDPRPGQLPRPRRLRPVRAGVPPRLADVGRGARPPPRRRPVRPKGSR